MKSTTLQKLTAVFILLAANQLIQVNTEETMDEVSKSKPDCLYDPKLKKMCEKHGKCVVIDGERRGVCVCKKGYGGAYCDEKDPEDCRKLKGKSADCSKHGECLQSDRWFYSCKCEASFTGAACESQLGETVTRDDGSRNPCESFPCAHGGTCVEKGATHECKCVPEKKLFPRSGFFCENVDYTNPKGRCKTSFCKGGAKCNALKKVFKKVLGRHRQSNHERDAPATTADIYTYVRNSNRYVLFGKSERKSEMCLCPAGKQGYDCRHDCEGDRYGEACYLECNEGCATGKCPSKTGLCGPDECKAGYTGHYCETKLPEAGEQCDPDEEDDARSCEFDGECIDKGGYMECDCPEGRRTPFCREECQVGFHGKECKERCGRCAKTESGSPVCDPVSGDCIKDEKTKKYCKSKWDKPKKCKVGRFSWTNIKFQMKAPLRLKAAVGSRLRKLFGRSSDSSSSGSDSDGDDDSSIAESDSGSESEPSSSSDDDDDDDSSSSEESDAGSSSPESTKDTKSETGKKDSSGSSGDASGKESGSGSDSESDAGSDTGSEAGSDSSWDTVSESDEEDGPDSGSDSGSDAKSDAGSDAGSDDSWETVSGSGSEVDESEDESGSNPPAPDTDGSQTVPPPIDEVVPEVSGVAEVETDIQSWIATEVVNPLVAKVLGETAAAPDKKSVRDMQLEPTHSEATGVGPNASSKRRIRRQTGQEIDGFQIDADLQFPASMTDFTDLKQEIEISLRDNAPGLRLDYFPELEVDVDSIVVSEPLVLDNGDAEEADDNNYLTSPYFIAGVVFIVMFIIASIATIIVVRRKNTKPTFYGLDNVMALDYKRGRLGTGQFGSASPSGSFRSGLSRSSGLEEYISPSSRDSARSGDGYASSSLRESSKSRTSSSTHRPSSKSGDTEGRRSRHHGEESGSRSRERSAERPERHQRENRV